MAGVAVADIFSGCGGLSVGLGEGLRRIGRAVDYRLAIDSDPVALRTYVRNLRPKTALNVDVLNLFRRVGDRVSRSERDLAQSAGRIDILVGGPPCQGYSALNRYRTKPDPRRDLYFQMVRAAQVFGPTVVIIENVPGVDGHTNGVLGSTREALEGIGYEVEASTIQLERFGIPQKRKRHVLIAIDGASASAVFDGLASGSETHQRGLEWAIDDLLDRAGESPFDSPSVPSVVNRRRMDWLFDHDEYELPNDLRPRCHQGSHRYRSMYGRLKWQEPAPTITSGYGSMGQGRFVHPLAPRTLTPHEAARIQTFPDTFDFGRETRSSWAVLIGNAVPPLLNVPIVRAIMKELGSGTHDID